MKEFRDGNVEVESEAFDRYMQNVGLLEEVFGVNSEFDNQIRDEQSSRLYSSSDGDNTEGMMVHGLKSKLRSKTATIESFRKRIQYIVDQGLKKVGKLEVVDVAEDVSDTEGQGRTTKKIKSMPSDKAMALSDLNDKLTKARNEDDLKACREMASQIFPWNTKKGSQPEPGESPSCMEKVIEDDDSSTKRDAQFFPPKWVNPATIDQEALCRIDAQFSSLEEIEDL